MRLRHVADVKFWARLRTQKRSDERIDAGQVGDIASGASYTPLKITRPRGSSKARKATSETPQTGLAITAAPRALSPSASATRRHTADGVIPGMTADSALAELAYRKPRVILFAGDPRAHNPRHRRCRCAGHRVGRLSQRRPRRPRRLGGDLRRGGGPAGTAVSQSQLSHSAVFPALRPRAERAPGLKALATSRGALRIRGEKVVAVARLGIRGRRSSAAAWS